ncbi:MAG TPA: hypothetical protein VKA55_08685 [Gammaproteobacteria bacterium]|nr:hypothetical protein [Gammaproteobacteria bacterium]
MRLNILAFAITCALLWGFGIFLGAWWIILLEGPSADPTLIGRIYVGFDLTPAGTFLGLLWGLGDGLIGGAVFAGLYNAIAGRLGGTAGGD